MQPFAYIIKEAIPDYLRGLPIPENFKGWFHLSVKEWAQLLIPGAAAAGAGYVVYLAFDPKRRGSCGKGHVNKELKKNVAKVVDSVEIEDIADKAVFCRCWKSKNWPYCDGSHAKHNESTGDNVGPLIVSRAK